MSPNLKIMAVLALALLAVVATTLLGMTGVLDPQSVAALLAGATTGPLGFILGMNGQAAAVTAATEAAQRVAVNLAREVAARNDSGD